MRVTVPVTAAPGLLIAIHGHAAQRYFDIDRGFDEGEGERDVERFFRDRGRFHDAILDVHPGQLVVQRDRRRDGGEALERALDYEAHANPRQALAATAHELGLCELE